MQKREHFVRYIGLGMIFVVVCLVFLVRLINIQVASQDFYTETSGTKTYTRTVLIQAQRGSIYDRNGKALITSEYTYDMYLDAGSLPSSAAEQNAVLLKIVSSANQMHEEDAFTRPENPFEADGDGWKLNSDYMKTVYGRRLTRLMLGLNLEQTEEETWERETIAEARELLLARYGIVDEEGNWNYSDEDGQLLFDLRLDMELHNFSTIEPYTILEDISIPLITGILEGTTRGVQVSCEATRVYHYPGLASHILGRVGRITAETAEYYTEQGYSLDAIVGTSGAEKAFEEYLRGIDGQLTIVEDGYGNVLDQYVSVEPVAGQDVYLTIDVEIQAAAEQALADNVALIVENALASGEALSGEDANAGALTAVNAKTGEVLALASYPSYDLTTFNETYKELNEDKNAPLFNRALEGTYAPGSTFKPGVAAAAMQEGIITPYTEIEDKGKYTYYENSEWSPQCWIYAEKYGRRTHGYINVSEAIQVSCNYFFYEVGRLLTIRTMDRYCESYGLGKPTGIEIAEKTGILAGPEEREAQGKTWYDGDTLQAAIGQSDHVFTPLQISMYIATLLNGGTRPAAHILHQTRDFSGNVLYEPEPENLSSITLDDEIVSTIRYAMKDVTEYGSASRVFSNYPIPIGGKTGTAQVSSSSSDNALFTAFAPFDDPEIIATCVIEHGANGTDAGFAIRDLFDVYFGLNNDDGDEGAA